MTKAPEKSADQCYFGYTNRGHGVLGASFDNKELLIFLSRVTDLPINKPADVHPGIFYGCHRFQHYLVFTKTFPDQQSIRSGMVFTHAIIIEMKLSESINKLEQLFNFFVIDIPATKPAKLPRLTMAEQNDKKKLISASDQKLLPILNFFLAANEDQALVMPLNQEMPELYIQLWNTLTPALRYLLTFRLTFNPADIEPSNYQLYFTPTMLLTRWPREMQYAAYNDTTGKVFSESTRFLLASEHTAPFTDFIHGLSFQVKDFKGLRLGELAFSYYKQLNNLDAGKLIQLLRLILRLSPARTDGRLVKPKIIAQLVKKLEQTKTDTFPVLSLANIEPAALENFSATISPKIEHKIISWWRDRNIEFLEMVIARRVEAPASDWWLTAIDTSFEKQIRDIADYDVTLIYQLWTKTETAIAYLWNLLKSTQHTETLLIDNLPKSLDDNVFSQLLPLVKQRQWLQLHASIITQKWKPEKALAEQLAITTDDKASLTIIANRFAAPAFIKMAINHNNPVLQEIALSLPVEIKDLTLSFKIENEKWQEFIQAKLTEWIRQKRKITTFKPIIDLILNGIVEGKYIDNKLLSLIATTSFANISDYPNRSEVWAKLQGPVKSAFLEATGSALLEHLTTTSYLEPALKDAMLSLNIIGNYISAQSRNWPDILRLFEIFPSLPEKYLVDHLRYSTAIDTPVNGARLGNLVERNRWRNCANIIYENAKYDDSYKKALEPCLNLLDFFKKMKVKYTFTNMSYTWAMSETEWLTNFETLCIEMYDEENDIRIIWKKAQGDVADLKNRESARVIWHHALQNLKKGKTKNITFRKLLIEMMTNVPFKKEQLQMLLSSLNEIKSIR